MKRTIFLRGRRNRKRNNELLTDIIRLGILVLGTVITTYVIPFIKIKIGEHKYNELTNFIDRAVRAMYQYYTDAPENNNTKKARVTAMAKEFMMNTLKLELTDEQLDLIIEGIYNEVKKAKEKD